MVYQAEVLEIDFVLVLEIVSCKSINNWAVTYKLLQCLKDLNKSLKKKKEVKGSPKIFNFSNPFCPPTKLQKDFENFRVKENIFSFFM